MLPSNLIAAPKSLVFVEFALVLGLVWHLMKRPRGIWRAGGVRSAATGTGDAKELSARLKETSGDHDKRDFGRIEAGLLKAGLKTTSDEPGTDFLTTKVLASIDYAIKRHDWYEDQRFRIFQVAVAMTTTLLSILAVVSSAGATLSPSWLLILRGLGLSAAICLVTMIYLYNSDLDADRPHRYISDVRFWYFRYNLPSHGAVGVPLAPDAAASHVAAERDRFMERVADGFAWLPSLREDLEQLFILHTLQRAKSESLVQMRWVLSYFLIAAVLHGLLLLFCQ